MFLMSLNSVSKINLIGLALFSINLFVFGYMSLIFSFLLRTVKLKYIDPLHKVICCRKYLFLTYKKYNFNQLEGYSTGRLRALIRGDDKLNKFVMIIKDNRVLLLMDERHIKNLPELENSIKELKYLGYRNLNRLARWRLILGID